MAEYINYLSAEFAIAIKSYRDMVAKMYSRGTIFKVVGGQLVQQRLANNSMHLKKITEEDMETIKIYGVYKGGWEGMFLEDPVYMNIEDAVKAAERLVIEEQKLVNEMQDFLKNEEFEFEQEYRDWEKVDDYVWQGGYNNQYRIVIKALELVK